MTSITGIGSSHFRDGKIVPGNITVDITSKFLEFMHEQNEEELIDLYRRTIDYVAILQDCLDNDWDKGPEARTKWLSKLSISYTETYILKNVIKDSFPDRLDYVDGGDYSGSNPINEIQTECAIIDIEAKEKLKKKYRLENSGSRSRNNDQESGTDPNPDIPFCHYRNSVYRPRWYARQDKNKATIFRMNIRVLVDKSGEPLGVPPNWRPSQIEETFVKTLKETIKRNGEEIDVPMIVKLQVPINVPDTFAILKLLSTGYVSADIMELNLFDIRCESRNIEGKNYYLKSILLASDEESMLSKLKVANIPATWKDPNQWSHKLVEQVARKKITYLKEGGLPFYGSKQLYFDDDNLQYEQQKGSRLRFTITNQHYFPAYNAFLQAVNAGTASTCRCRDKQGTKLQAYKVMRCPVLRGSKTVMKNIVIYTDLKW